MTSRSKEKMAAAFRKIFRSSEKISESDATGSGATGQGKGNGSPARRLLSRHTYHRDVVTPTESSPLDNPGASRTTGSVFKKKNTSSSSQPELFTQKTVRSRRLMKELKDIQRNERKDPIFTVSMIYKVLNGKT